MRRILMLGLCAMSCATGSETPAPGPDAGQPGSCPSDTLTCGGFCADPLTDPKHCGECGRACDVGTCHRGFCRCRTDADCAGGEDCRFNLCRPPDYDGIACAKDAECGAGRICAAGYCTTSICETEACDGWDNDCNGKTDEPEKIARPCYTGPKETEGVGECRGGTVRCVAAKEVCEGQQIPIPEKGFQTCDDKDNNCDGCIDGAGGTLGCESLIPPYFEIVMIIDTSGSMSDDIVAANAAADRFTAQFAGKPRIRFALVRLATYMDTPPYFAVVQPLSDWTVFKTALSALWADGASFEPGYDVIHDISAGALDTELGFRPGALRILVVMTDEKARSHMPKALTEAEACAPVIANDVVLSVITPPMFYTDWDACAAGRTFPLDPDIEATVKNLNSTLVLPCFNRF